MCERFSSTLENTGGTLTVFCDYTPRSVPDVKHHHLAPEVREIE